MCSTNIDRTGMYVRQQNSLKPSACGCKALCAHYIPPAITCPNMGLSIDNALFFGTKHPSINTPT